MPNPLSAELRLTVSGFDWGPSLRFIDVVFSDSICLNNVHPDQLDVTIRKQMQTTSALIDKLESFPGRLRLRLKVHPTFTHLSPLVYDHQTRLHRFTPQFDAMLDFKQPLASGFDIFDSLRVETESTMLYPDLEGIIEGRYRFNHSHHLSYAFYDPKPSDLSPLIVWLHGAGEGGTDPKVVLLGNPAFRLIQPTVQSAFQKAYVLYPQAPTFWMDDGSGKYTTNGTSFYARALFGLIANMVRHTPGIDPKRVLIGGNSNGGFMCIRMLLDHPGYFAAAFPICEAYLDQWLQESDRRSLQEEAIWFHVSKDDPVVDPALFTLATYRQLAIKPGGNIHLSLFDQVIDPSGEVCDDQGYPYRYGGHASWILVLSGCSKTRINEQEVSLFDWLAHRKIE